MKQMRTDLTPIAAGIRKYAAAYSELERLQNAYGIYLPNGDQKTGVIAEFYARLYASYIFPNATLCYGSTSEPGWDIKIKVPPRAVSLVQVKAVSAYSKTSRISPIHGGWDYLWLLRLDGKFWPEAFWELKAGQVAWSKQTMSHRTMPTIGMNRQGSTEFAYAMDKSKEFIAIIGKILGASSKTHGK